MATTCVLSLRVLKLGTESDGVTARRRNYVTIDPALGLFAQHNILRIRSALTVAGIKFTCDDTPLPGGNSTNRIAIRVADMFNAISALKNGGVDVTEHVPFFVWQFARDADERSEADDSNVSRGVGEELWGKMHPYQQVAVRKAIETRCSYLGDDPGSGKTLQCLATCKYFSSLWPVLVLCPSSLKYTWRSQIGLWLGVPEDEVLVAKSAKHLLKNVVGGNYKFVIVTYGLISKVLECLLSIQFKVQVLDEAHLVKSMNSKRADAAFKLSSAGEVKMLLSGTPFNYPSEMYQQIRILYPQVYPRFFNGRMTQDRDGEYFYAKRYCKPQSFTVRGREVWSFHGYDNHEELNAVLNVFMIRRRKHEILTQLPSKNRICITLEPLPKKQETEIVNKLKEAQQKEAQQKGDEKKEGAAGARSDTSYMEAFRLTSQYKQPRVVDFVKEQIVDDLMVNDESAKVILFFHHDAMREALEECLKNASITYFLINGATDPKRRNQYVQDFQTANTYRVALLSITAAGVGLTLTAANTVVFSEILFGPDQHLQAEDRAHRIGQRSDVNIFYLIQPKTTDDINFGLIKKKERESSVMIDGTASAVTSRRAEAGNALEATRTRPAVADDDSEKQRPAFKRFKPREDAEPEVMRLGL